MLKAIGIVGSPRKGGNTEILVSHCLKAIAEEGLATELVHLAGLNISGCNGCGYCFAHPGECSIVDDLQPVFQKMLAADVIIVGSPVYYSSAPALLRAFLERAGFMGRGKYTGKIGGPLVVARRAGQNFTFAELLFWFHIQQIINPGSIYWNVAFGREKGEVTKDEEGMRIAWEFGKNCARLAKKVRQ
ncbi:MAG: flavodoxin family protein [Dehalococcoidales bacterium]|nr:flavodoxin family protein [Dehalococcoidales bacterium]